MNIEVASGKSSDKTRSELSKALEEAKQQNVKTTRDLVHVREEVGTLKGALQIAIQARKTAEQNASHAHATNAPLERQVKALEEDLQGRRDAAKENAKLRTTMKDLRTENTRLREQVENLKKNDFRVVAEDARRERREAERRQEDIQAEWDKTRRDLTVTISEKSAEIRRKENLLRDANRRLVQNKLEPIEVLEKKPDPA